MATSGPKSKGNHNKKGGPEKNKRSAHQLFDEHLFEDYKGDASRMYPTIFLNPVPAGNGRLDLKTNSEVVRGNLPVQPMIIWNDKAVEAGNNILKYRNFEGIKRIYPELEPHANLMYDRLSYHKAKFGNNSWPDPLIMVGMSCVRGQEFTEEYLDDWKLAKFRWMNMKFNTETDKKVQKTVSSYSDHYIGYHFIFWKEADPEDYLAMMGLPPDTGDDIFEEIKQFAAEISAKYMSDEEIHESPPDDYIFRPVATGGFTGEKTMPEWEIEYDSPYGDIEEEILCCARSTAPKRPGETRDIGIQKPSSLRYHRRIMWNLKRICGRISGCVYGKSSDYIRDVVSRIGKHNDFFYMRDYTKSGMTIPHRAIRAIFEGVYQRRPDFGNKAASFFERQQLYFKNGDEYEMTRPQTGSPLGMFVEGYTILQYVIHQINLVNLPPGSARQLSFSATNDDMVVGSKNKRLIEHYNNVDINVNSEIGMSYKDTKSGISENRFVFCEEYWIDDHIDTKDALFSITLIGAKYCNSVHHAKEYSNALLMSAGELTPLLVSTLREVQTHWGPEFHEDEFNWPYLFGGWLPQIQGGVDTSIRWFNGDLRAIAGYWATRTKLSKKGKLDEKPHLALGRKSNIKLVAEPDDIPDWVDLVPYLGSKRTLKRHFRLAHSAPREISTEYRIMQSHRINMYNGILSGKFEKEDIMKDWLVRHPNSYILDSMPFIQTEDSYTCIQGPRYGVRDNSEKMRLLWLQSEKYIEVDHIGVTSSAAKRMAHAGIIERCKYKVIPLGKSGISSWVLSNHPRNFYEFYRRTGKTILSVSDTDQPFKYTNLWGYMPWASLLSTIRMWDVMVKHEHRPPDIKMFLKWSDYHFRLSKERIEGFSVDEDPDDLTEFDNAEYTRQLISDMIRESVDNPDEFVKNMGNRIVVPSNFTVDHSDAIRLWNAGESFTLMGASPEGNELGYHEGQEDQIDDIADPWGELGVT